MQEATAALEELERQGLMSEALKVLPDVPLLARVENVGLYKSLLGIGEIFVKHAEKQDARGIKDREKAV